MTRYKPHNPRDPKDDRPEAPPHVMIEMALMLIGWVTFMVLLFMSEGPMIVIAFAGVVISGWRVARLTKQYAPPHGPDA